MIEDDAAYFARRAFQEQLAAQQATCKAARDRHDALAMIYRFRAAMVATHPRSWVDVLQQQGQLA